MAEIADGHLNVQAPIDAYGNGGFRFADMSHIGSILSLPTGMHKWALSDVSELANADFSSLWEQASDIDVFLLGTGNDIAFIDEDIRQQFRDHSIILEPMSTGAAVRTFNVLYNEQRAVSAGLIAVDRAK